jgi:capsular exopolysaccharide synthesis family protein
MPHYEDRPTSLSVDRRHQDPSFGPQVMTPYYMEPIEMSDAGPRQGRDLFDYVRLLRRRKFVIAAAGLLGIAGGFVLASVQTPMFRARTAIEIQSMAESDSLYRIIDGDWRGTGGGPAAVTAESYLETQLRVLDSKTFQKRVEEKLQAAPRASGSYTLSKPRQLLSLVGIRGEAPTAGLTPPVAYESRVLENTRIVELTAESPDPDYAAEFANTVAREFIDYNRELQSETAQRTLKWLTDQMESMKSKVDIAKTRLDQYSRDSGLQYETERPAAEKEKLKDLEKGLETARLERIQTQAAYDAAIEEARKQQLYDDRLVAQEMELVRKRAEMDQLSKRYTPQHSDVLKLAAEIATLQQILDRQSTALVANLRRTAEAARLREERLVEAIAVQTPIVSDVARKGAEYDTLRRDLERNQKLYEDLLQKATEVSLSTAMRASSQIRVVDEAEPPPAPYRPSRNRLLALGLATGLIGGMGLVLISERVDKRIRGPRETVSYLGLPELAVVPRHAELARTRKSAKRLGAFAWLRRRKPQPSAVIEISRQHDHPSFLSESFRDAVASILATVREKQSATRILVTSASNGDGKSTVVTNLGLSLADLGYAVLLVDGDLRRPTLNEIVDVGNSWGLSTLVTDSADLAGLPPEALFQPTSIERLSILTTGPGPKSVSRVLHSRRTSKLFERLSEQFDFILVDTPPALQFSDARLLGRLVDWAILVIKADETSRDDAHRVVRRLLDDNIPIMGTILNGWNRKAPAYYGYYGYTDTNA